MAGSLPDGRRRPGVKSPNPDRTAFVRANTTLRVLPHVPQLRLHLADEAHDLWHRTHDDLQAIGLQPPFWAFAWAGGQGLARYVLAHPGLVAGRHVLDFATGSGLVAIAAAKAGAAKVTAVDIDAYCGAAVALNAMANGVSVDFRQADVVGTDEGWDVILAGDVFYDKAFCDHFLPWLRALAGRGAEVLVGDPGRAYLPDGLESLAVSFVPVSLAIEGDDIKRTTVWRFRSPSD
jgi:predicted nicotinamide N-methyase